MHVSLFDYDLPPELIAQTPLQHRDQARMLLLRRGSSVFQDGDFRRLPEYLQPGSVLVLNNTRVFPARLAARREGYSGRVEVLLLRPVERGTVWEVVGKPGRVLRINTTLVFGDGRLTATIIRRLEGPRRLIQFHCETGKIDDLIDQLGTTPLPPYIKRPTPQGMPADADRYQTIFARHRGAIAAPTAGLHFTDEIIRALMRRGVEVLELTHHVGYATFQPFREDEIELNRLEPEEFNIPLSTATRINQARGKGLPILAVGTTTVRALESAADDEGLIRSGPGRTQLLISPGYRFKVIDMLLTNFHLPRSSPLVLVSAFAGRVTVLEAYRHAISHKYRFYSYGDCMLIM